MEKEIHLTSRHAAKDLGSNTISFVEYQAPNFSTFEGLTKAPVTTYYYSPFYIPAVDIKLDSANPALDLALAMDLVTSVMQAFSTS